MDLDCEMDISFAKRLEKQQMRSPVSPPITRKFSITSPCKRQLEIDSYNLDSHDSVQNVPEIMVDNKLIRNEKQILKRKNGFTKSADEENYAMSMTQPNTLVTKDSFCEVNNTTPVTQISEVDMSLRLCNRKQEACVNADRYIPSRVGNTWHTTNFSENSSNPASKKIKECLKDEVVVNENIAYSCILRNELLGESIEQVKRCSDVQVVSLPEQKKLFKYSSPVKNDKNIETHSYSLSPVGAKSQKLLRSPCKAVRKISKVPFKILDAPDLQQDFYLNVVDWSSQNVLGVGLGNSVFLWSAYTSQVVRLCDLTNEGDSVTSVAWNDKGNYLAVGTNSGFLQIWDVTVSKKVANLSGHSARIGTVAWNGSMLATGSRDKMIMLRDVRLLNRANSSCCYVQAHRQEVCGLKWSPDGMYLASGGNDNRLYIWNKRLFLPYQTFTDHTAAVKAIAWSPHHHGLLASGGGTADRCIRFWNTLTTQCVQCVDTGSQVCNLVWSKNSSELVSTHGYSQNHIVVWKYPSLAQVVKLSGHTSRVLYLAMSPDGESIVTGAGDETLKFWNVFSKTLSQKENKSVLNLFSTIR